VEELVELITAEISNLEQQRNNAAKIIEQATGAIESLQWALMKIDELSD